MNKEINNTNSTITAFAVLIAIVAVFYAGMMHGKSGTVAVAPAAPTDNGEAVAPSGPQITPDLDILTVRRNDAVRGGGDIVLIEYSDYECPFCQQFHKTAQALVDSGEVGWVYRHLPLPFHATAKDGAVLGECVKTHKGSDAFWTYTDSVFAESELNLEAYKRIARNAGLSDAQINDCLVTGSDQQRAVDQDMQDAQTMGVNGTPGSFLVNTKTKAVESIPGALPIGQVQSLLKAIQ